VSELLPCPFCGGKTIGHHHIRDGRVVACRDCSASVRSFHPNAQEGAFEKWNSRAPQSSQPAPTRPEPTAYLISHAKHGRALDFQQITDGDRNAGFSSEALYTNAPQSTATTVEPLVAALKMARARIEYLGAACTNEKHFISNERDFLPQIDAALSAAPVSAWQDISTAPKDGTVILLASTDERGSKNLIECSWWSEERCWIDNGRRGKPDEYEADWYQVDNTDFSFSRPTHWRMPLSRPRNDGQSGGARS
jgi:Lar family restriction alleviation protein